jgi:ribosomal protein S18 acetylase RimI-like enzyme
MKRLYVTPEGRGLGLGRRLAEHCVAQAAARGYRRMRLETLPDMAAARHIYATLGFRPTGAYNDNPVAGVIHMALDLSAGAAGG